jgi:hypothetical protein
LHSKASAIFSGILPGTHNRVLNGLDISFSKGAFALLGSSCPIVTYGCRYWERVSRLIPNRHKEA